MTATVVPLRPKYQPEAFERFWEAYPKKQKKGPARRQWQWAMEAVGHDAERLIAAAERYATYCRRQGIEDKFQQFASNFLMDERWDDVYPEQPKMLTFAEAEDARLRELARVWFTPPLTNFKADWVKKNLSEADRQLMIAKGLIK